MATPKSLDTPVNGLQSVTASSSDRSIARRTEWSGHRFQRSELSPVFGSEEGLVLDDRASLRPAQVVEIKLARMLQEAALPVSHLQMRDILRGR